MAGTLQMALIDNRYKLVSFDSGHEYMLFDLIEDGAETRDVGLMLS